MPKCLLIIDPVTVNRIGLAALFKGAQYEVMTARSPQEIPANTRSEPDLVILGLHSDSPAASVAETKGQVGLSEAPVLCIDSDPSPMRRLQALRAGARDILNRALPDALLLARLRGLIREGETERESERRRVTAASFGLAEAAQVFEVRARVACLGEAGAMPTLPSVLSSSLPHRFDSLSVDDVLRDDINGKAPDAYVIVSGEDYLSLDTILPELRDRSHSRHAPVLVLYPPTRPDIATRALNLGASDVAPTIATGEELAIRMAGMLKRKRLRDTLRQSDEHSYRMAATDPLTGLYNRRYAESYLADLMMREQDSAEGFILMIVDLDLFKAVNDTHGHSAGDQVLCEVADRLRDNLRACDLVSRHGGEEFLVVLPETDVSEARRTAERLRRAISSAPIAVESGTRVRITASIGVAVGDAMEIQTLARRTGTFDAFAPRPSVALNRVFEAADQALYLAKSRGRNRVEFSAV